MSFFGKLGRGLAGVATGGLSEVALRTGVGKNALAALGLVKSPGVDTAQQALNLFSNIKDPQLKQIALQNYASVADPRDFVKALGDSNFKNIQEDPALKNAQMTALNRFQAIADQGGLTAQDQKLLNDIKTQEKTTEQGQRKAILQNAEQRGIAGSGLELANQLGATQSGAQTAAQRGTDVAAQAADRQMQAAQLAGNLGTAIRGQEFSQAAQGASAQDVIDRFNAQALNQAGQEAFQNQQNIANQNTQLANQQQMYNTQQIPQQQFENQMALAQQRAAALNKVGAAQTQQTDRFGNFIGNLAKVGGTVAALI